MKRFFFLWICLVLCTLACHSTDFVAITEVLYDTPYNEDTTITPHNFGEFIELYNTHEEIADISGWTLQTLSPAQTFTFPAHTIIPPHSVIVVAYGDLYPYNEVSDEQSRQEGWTDFHDLYLIEPTTCLVLHQTALLLPNVDGTILLLRDNKGVTRDSLAYGWLQNVDGLYAPNRSVPSYSFYSAQRMHIDFDSQGVSCFDSHYWEGYFESKAGEISQNSVGRLTDHFSGCNILSPASSANGQNYIQCITPLVSLSAIDMAAILRNPSLAQVQRDYYDAMYRPYMNIVYHNTPERHNTATLAEYDCYNRPTRQWLPIAVEMSHLTPTTFKGNATQFFSEDSKPYTETLYSTTTWSNDAIRNEPVGVRQAGKDMGSRMQALSSRSNRRSEVRRFSVTSTGTLRCNGYYPDSTLLVQRVTDEDGKYRTIYTSQQGQTIMERYGDDADTYYVYNLLGQLSFVLPPLAADALSDGTYPDTVEVLRQYAYVYRYDERGNLIYKRLPGCEPVLMVYDRTNCLVLSQDGNQRVRGTYWTSYKYDYLRRLIYTAEVNTGSNDYQDNLNSFRNWYVIERFSAESLKNLLSNTGYSRNFYHIHPTRLLTVNYYDNYDFLTLLPDSIRTHFEYISIPNVSRCSKTMGLLTGTRTYYLDGSGDYSTTVYYYDYRGREIERLSSNHLGGYDITKTTYNFSDNIVDTWASQSTANGVQTDEHYHYTYDHANRLLTTTYTYNNEAPIVLQSFSYDELGRVRKRAIHDAIDSICFSYNIRNQLTQIRSTGYTQNYYYTTDCPQDQYQTMRACYNGNIAATTWTYGDKTNGYIYYYDSLNRLKDNYSILNGEWNDYYYSESFDYDKHSNITTLTRWDHRDIMDWLHITYQGNQAIEVENTYNVPSFTYDCKRYQDANDSGDDFAYDANGNIRYDKDRGIAAIRYNLLNLPDTIQFSNGNQIIHTYDAAGNRLRTSYYTRKVTTTVPLGNTLPVGTTANYYATHDIFHRNCVYHAPTAASKDYAIEFVHNSEGYIRYLTKAEHYHFYYIKDHLGNVRETYVRPSANYKQCIQRMQYYPSGLPWNTNYVANEQPYKYNGKEFVEMHGLDEYDSHARWYYPALARTTTMDPHSEDYYPTSPYAWCGNNFVNAIDPTGMDWYSDSNDSTIIRWTDFSSQKEMDENGIAGKYIGEAYVVFNGSRNEKLGIKEGKWGYIDGEGAVTASVTLYGPQNKNDVHKLTGYTMTSNPDLFAPIAEGTYTVNYDEAGKSGSIKSHWAINERKRVPTMDGRINFSPFATESTYGTPYADGVFIHRTNLDGGAGYSKTAAVSSACLLLTPKDFIIYDTVLKGV